MENYMWEIMISILVQVFALIPADIRSRTDAQEQMRIAVMKAFHKTEAYYSQRECGAQRNRADELKIALLWEYASIRVEKYDKDLAKRLGRKSEFWRDENIWSNEQIKNVKIGLSQVKSDAMNLRK